MPVGLLIKVDGTINEINYSDVYDGLLKLCDDLNNVKMFEIFEDTETHSYLLFCKKRAMHFNLFDFLSGNVKGDVFIIYGTEDCNMLFDINKETFLHDYTNKHNLEHHIIEDELEEKDNDYDYNDDFLIRD